MVSQGCGGGRKSPLTLRSLHESVVKRQRLDNGGVRLGALLELLQGQLPVRVLRREGRGERGTRARPKWLPVEMPELPAGGKRGSGCLAASADVWFSVLGRWPLSAGTNHKVLLCSAAHTHTHTHAYAHTQSCRLRVVFHPKAQEIPEARSSEALMQSCPVCDVYGLQAVSGAVTAAASRTKGNSVAC